MQAYLRLFSVLKIQRERYYKYLAKNVPEVWTFPFLKCVNFCQFIANNQFYPRFFYCIKHTCIDGST